MELITHRDRDASIRSGIPQEILNQCSSERYRSAKAKIAADEKVLVQTRLSSIILGLVKNSREYSKLIKLEPNKIRTNAIYALMAVDLRLSSLIAKKISKRITPKLETVTSIIFPTVHALNYVINQ